MLACQLACLLANLLANLLACLLTCLLTLACQTCLKEIAGQNRQPLHICINIYIYIHGNFTHVFFGGWLHCWCQSTHKTSQMWPRRPYKGKRNLAEEKIMCGRIGSQLCCQNQMYIQNVYIQIIDIYLNLFRYYKLYIDIHVNIKSYIIYCVTLNIYIYTYINIYMYNLWKT